MPPPNQEQKSGWGAARKAGWGAGAATFGASFIDVRPRTRWQNVRPVGQSWSEISKMVRPGDVLIGANRLPQEALKSSIRGTIEDYGKVMEDLKLLRGGRGTKHYEALEYKNLKKALGWAPPQVQAAAGAFGLNTDMPTHLSKSVDPYWSHGEMVVVPPKGKAVGKTAFAGGAVWDPRREILPGTKGSAKAWAKRGQTPHYLIMRPKAGSEYARMFKQDPKAAEALVRKTLGKYKTGWIFPAGIREFAFPHLRRGERALSSQQIAKNIGCVGGVCSTLGAKFSRQTVGGKSMKMVLPSDYLRSSNWKAIGRVGGKPTIGLGHRALYASPKYLAKGIVAGVAGLGAYGAVKGIQALTRKKGQMEKQSAYESAFIDELQKLGAPLTLTDKEKKQLVGGSGFLGSLGGALGGGMLALKAFRGSPTMGLLVGIPTILAGGAAGRAAARGAARTLGGIEAEKEAAYNRAFAEEFEKEAKKAKLGSGARFKKLKKSIAAKGDVSDPGAVAAAIGRKKYGKKRFQQMAAAGK